MLHDSSDGIIAKLRPLPLRTFAGILKLGLQPRQTVEQLIPLVFNLSNSARLTGSD